MSINGSLPARKVTHSNRVHVLLIFHYFWAFWAFFFFSLFSWVHRLHSERIMAFCICKKIHLYNVSSSASPKTSLNFLTFRVCFFSTGAVWPQIHTQVLLMWLRMLWLIFTCEQNCGRHHQTSFPSTVYQCFNPKATPPFFSPFLIC